MKLSSRDAARFIARPDPAVAGILLHGADAMRVAIKRKALVDALVGASAAEEMRLARLAGAELRRDPAALLDAVKAVGFFPGPRAVLVEEAGEPALAAVKAALEDWAAGDATIVVAAGGLGAGSGLRKTFEAARNAVAIAVYADPPDRGEVEAALAAAGLAVPDREVAGEVEALARALDPGDFAQFIEKLALYKRGDAAPLSSDDVAAVAPPAGEAEVDEVLMLAADGDARGLARALRDLGGTSATSVTIAAGRYFRTLHAAACAGDRGKNLFGENPHSRMISATAGACDARMDGALIPVMSNSGSGNQGVAATLPVLTYAEDTGCDEESLIRALILSNLSVIYIKQYLGRLSALCGCVVAASGSSCAITYLMGGDYAQVTFAIKNMIANITGMICDGAKPSCALKIASGTSTAMLSALMAMENKVVTSQEGIVDDDVDKTIQNLAIIGSKGMAETDKIVLDVMTRKG